MPRKKSADASPDPFAAAYPNVTFWVKGGNWIEIGPNGGLTSFVRALDDGGMVFEGKAKYPTMDAALRALDEGIKAAITGAGKDQ